MKRKMLAMMTVPIVIFFCACSSLNLYKDQSESNNFKIAVTSYDLSNNNESEKINATSTKNLSAAAVSKQSILDYFCQIALKSEYSTLGDGIVRRWEQPINLEILGVYSQDDYKWLIAHINNLNKIDGMPEISIIKANGNFKIYFTTLDQLPKVIPDYVTDNWGFINITWDSSMKIISGTMGIATDVTNQKQRNHLILEEFTQGLGLLNDSSEYIDSIYQIKWTETQILTDIDSTIVRMLYCPVVKAGMNESKVRTNLASWLDEN